MSTQTEVYEKLEAEFDDFRGESARFRKQRIPRIEQLIWEAKFLNDHVYLSEKCTGFLGHCKEMARLRQPRHYEESQCICFALGDLSGIEWILVEGGPAQSGPDC